jgi:3-methyladenine DNA glycosylase AlkD
MDSSQIASQIRFELKKRENPKFAEKQKRFFKEEIALYGLRSNEVREVIKKFYPLVKNDFNLNFQVSEIFFKSNMMEENGIAVEFLRKMHKKLTPKMFETFDRWVDYLTNWAKTDSLSAHIIGDIVILDPTKIKELMKWTQSKNRWRRRASAVSLILPARRGIFLKEILSLSEKLMEDQDDMVQKGVGWLLKEASRKHPDEVRNFLLKWKSKTSALILHYASEKLPKNKRVLKTR